MWKLLGPVSSFIRKPQLLRMATTHATTIKSIDHIVLTVKSINITKTWYTNFLGMESESFVSAATPHITRHSLIFGQQKINLHEVGKVCYALNALHYNLTNRVSNF